MSFEINGETWTPQTAQEHAEQIIAKINAICQEQNITDANGNIVQLKQNYGNALYLLALGDGNRFADNDAKLEAAINSFNIELCDDEQIENLLPIAAINRNPGSYSTLQLTCTASDEGACVIPQGTKAPYGNVNFIVQAEVVISAGATQVIDTVCDTIGPVAVLTGEVTAFDTDIANLESVENRTSSVPGVAAETTDELRQRIIKGDTIKYSLDGCKGALEELTGVSYARVYFNYNHVTTLTLPGGVVLQPRHAYVVVYGSSDSIAETYANYMNAPTQNSPIAEGSKSTVNITVAANGSGSVTIATDTTATYDGHVFAAGAETVVPAGESVAILFTCTEDGPYNVPALGISGLDQELENLESAVNYSAAVPGSYNPAHIQNYITASGQEIPIHYDTATEANVFVKVVLKETSDSGQTIENQIKRDLITASASWVIGEDVTQLSTSAPFVNCSYAEVAYTQVSTDGSTWSETVEIGCNVIPRVSDGTISIDQL